MGHYYSTIYMEGVVPVQLTDSTNSAEIRAFIRTFKEDAAEALGLQENSDRVEVIDESKVVQTDQGVSISFMVHEPVKFLYISQEEEEAKRNKVVRLSQQAVEEESDNLFKKSTRNLVAVT